MNENQITINVNSIKSIYLEACFDNQKLANATGFLVKNNNNDIYLITNRHVVTGRNNETNECLDKKYSAIPNKLNIWFPYLENNYYVWKNISWDLYDKKENSIWLEHPLYKENVDVVAINLGKFDKLTFLHSLNSEYKPIVTENVYIIGYPFGFNVNPENGKYAIWSSASIASDPDLDLNINGKQLPAFLVDAKTRQGQSGSPVIYHSSNGFDRQSNGFAVYGGPITHEIGIYSGRINKDSDLGYVWKWSLIKDIVNQEYKN